MRTTHTHIVPPTVTTSAIDTTTDACFAGAAEVGVVVVLGVVTFVERRERVDGAVVE